MRAILKFKLPEEEAEYKMAVHGADYHSVLWNLDQHLRNFLKYGHQFSDVDSALEYIRKYIAEELNYRNAPFDFP